MIDAEHCQAFAAYNTWMNRKIYACAGQFVGRRAQSRPRCVFPFDSFDAQPPFMGRHDLAPAFSRADARQGVTAPAAWESICMTTLEN